MGKEDVDKVRYEDRPENWYCAEEEERHEEERNAHGMPEDNECLKAAFEGDIEGSPADPVLTVSITGIDRGVLHTRFAPTQHLLVFR